MIGWVWPGKVMALGAIYVIFQGGGVFASTPISSGTGFFVHPDGYILTCQHVIEGAGTIEVVLPDSTRQIAEAVEEDAYKDLALLKISVKNAPCVLLGDSDCTRVLETVIALGYPLQIGNEVAANEGKINAKRDSEKIPLFQIDTTVNPGNSGGPLVNDRGEVIGVIVAKLNAVKYQVLTGTIPEGINFAIPILYAKSLLKKVPEIKNRLKLAGKISPPDIFEKVAPATVLILKYDTGETTNPIIPATLKTITIPLANLPSGAKPLEMALIPAGAFMMGSDTGDSDEKPVHRVILTKDFYLGKYEVTQAQWEIVMGSKPSYFQGSNRPVEQVKWYDAAKFCNALSKLQGFKPVYDESTWAADMSANGFRLPTEAEWEYACRAGTTTDYYWKDGNIDEYAWYGSNSGSQTHDAGLKKPNDWGLFDMSGNVWEWCHDWYGNYSVKSQNDPTGANSGDVRVLRGGNWYSDGGDCRSAYHDGNRPGGGYDIVGFRVCRTK